MEKDKSSDNYISLDYINREIAKTKNSDKNHEKTIDLRRATSSEEDLRYSATGLIRGEKTGATATLVQNSDFGILGRNILVTNAHVFINDDGTSKSNIFPFYLKACQRFYNIVRKPALGSLHPIGEEQNDYAFAEIQPAACDKIQPIEFRQVNLNVAFSRQMTEITMVSMYSEATVRASTPPTSLPAASKDHPIGDFRQYVNDGHYVIDRAFQNIIHYRDLFTAMNSSGSPIYVGERLPIRSQFPVMIGIQRGTNPFYFGESTGILIDEKMFLLFRHFGEEIKSRSDNKSAP